MLLYHVTFTRNAPKIVQQGLVPLQGSNWTKRSGGRYGDGSIYVFENRWDAIRWAARMEWHYYQSSGKGKITILTIQDDGEWEEDLNDPIAS